MIYRTPLHYAAKKNQELAVRLLIDDGADTYVFDKNGFTPLHSACEYGSNDVINVLFEYKMDPNTTFRKGSQHIDTVELLHENGADVNIVNSNNVTPLNVSAQQEKSKILDKLLEFGGDPAIATNDLNETPLFTAVSFNSVPNVQSLIKANADVNAKSSKGVTPLHIASKYGFYDVAKILLENEAEVNAQDEQKVTPLHFATLQRSKDLVELLLDYGADPLLRNISGKSSFSLANSEISEILRQIVATRTQQKSQELREQRERERVAQVVVEEEEEEIEQEQNPEQAATNDQQNEPEKENPQNQENAPEQENQQNQENEPEQENQENQENAQNQEQIHQEEEELQFEAQKPVTPTHSRPASRSNSTRKSHASGKSFTYEDEPITNQAKYEFQEFEREVQDELNSFKSDVEKQIKELTRILMNARKEFLKSKRSGGQPSFDASQFQ